MSDTAKRRYLDFFTYFKYILTRKKIKWLTGGSSLRYSTFFRCASISWFQVSESVIDVFLQLAHLRVFQIIYYLVWDEHSCTLVSFYLSFLIPINVSSSKPQTIENSFIKANQRVFVTTNIRFTGSLSNTVRRIFPPKGTHPLGGKKWYFAFKKRIKKGLKWTKGEIC